MSEKLAGFYDDAFYDWMSEGAARSASVVLGVLFDCYRPATVVDVGCGRGAWLATAARLGARRLVGLDGNWVSGADVVSDDVEFRPVNFETGFDIGERFDLCISLEVAEHLPASRAASFVDGLCAASDVVLFSAAIPGQGGTNHVNERWQSYWQGHFARNGYECFDILRPAVWDDDDVEWWYRQNSFVFVRSGTASIDRARLKARERPIADIVHPRHHAGRVEYYRELFETPSLSFCVSLLARYLRRKLGELVNRRGRRADT